MDNNLLPTPEQVRIAKQKKEQERIAMGLCPECVEELEPIEGCKACRSCGWSACNN